MKSLIVPFTSGVLFSLGLALSGMTHPSKILAFLDFAGDWDPSLAFVMVGGLLVNFFAFRWGTRRGRPVFAPQFVRTQWSVVDARLIAGAAVFGVGWGLAGFCPGPALVSAMGGTRPAVLFVCTMLGSMLAFDAIASRRGRTGATARENAAA